jgi:hypothetical protein
MHVEADTWFRVTFAPPGGTKYAVTGRAISEQEAVRLADETVDHAERIGSVRDHLVSVESIPASEATSGFGLVITKADGTTVRK